MTTEGGNWKDLVKAICDADGSSGRDSGSDTDAALAIVRYHLECGVDPNFQHPEYMTTPLLEAVRVGHANIVSLLLKHKADPTLAGDLDDVTPMELALQQKHHAIVDLLLPELPDGATERECQTILVSGWCQVAPNYSPPFEMLRVFLELGHAVLLGTTSGLDDIPLYLFDLGDTLIRATGNRKIYVQPMDKLLHIVEADDTTKSMQHDEVLDFKWFMTKGVDTWIHKLTDTPTMISDVTTL